MRAKQRDALRLLLSGLAAAEASGSTSEFVPQSEIPALYARLKSKGWPFSQVGGGAFHWKPGEATDDGDQALCLVRSFVERGRFDPEDVGKQLVAWYDSGPRDIGGTTARTLSALRSGVPWHQTGLQDYAKHPNNAANGSLMRNVLPGIMFGEELDLLFRSTVQTSIITHAHPLAVLCCAAHSFIIADLLSEWGQGPTSDPEGWLDNFYEDWTAYVAGEDDPYVGAWLDRVRDEMQSAGAIITEADWNPFSFNPFTVDYTGRSGYVVLTLQVAVWCLLWSNMPDEPLAVPTGFPAEIFKKRGAWVCAWPAMLGWDADTVGAVTGPLCAAAHGSVPESMTEGLEALAEFDKLVRPCLDRE